MKLRVTKTVVIVLVCCLVVIVGMGIAYRDVFVSEDSLKLVALVFRHGARAPHHGYPNDIHKNENNIGVGVGSLTMVGVQQMFELGKNLNPFYESLFAREGMFRNYNFQAKSSFYERAFTSGLAFLSSFYPPNIKVNPLPINWQPIPIVPFTRDTDYLLMATACLKLTKLYEEVTINLPDFIEMKKRDKELISTFEKYSGFKNMSVYECALVFDTIKVHTEMNMSIPDWFKPEFWERYDYYFQRYVEAMSETEEMQVLRAGPLITEIIDGMEALTSTDKPKRVFVYSGHDITLKGLSRALNIESQLPHRFEYGSTIAFELHKPGEHYEVQINFFESWKSTQPKIINIPECPEPCSLDEFKKVYNYLIVRNIEELCKI